MWQRRGNGKRLLLGLRLLGVELLLGMLLLMGVTAGAGVSPHPLTPFSVRPTLERHRMTPLQRATGEGEIPWPSSPSPLSRALGTGEGELSLSGGGDGGKDPAPPASPQVVRVFYGSREELQALADAGYDIWEVHPDYAVLALGERQQALLEMAGYRVEPDTALTARLLAPSDYPCYRTVEEIEAHLQVLATTYPTLTELIDIGDSWEKVTPGGEPGYDLWMLRLSNEALPGPKPRFILLAEHHAREMITPELAVVFIDYLLERYGSDPQVTWLLDYREILVMPLVNPDGHKKAEEGLYWRKNTDNDDGCSDEYLLGVDLNRNYSYQWGGSGSGDGPCDMTYRGPGPFSEPETQAIRDYLTSLYTSVPGGGILITLHSYSNLVLWPWGYTEALAPDAEGLQAIGERLAAFNGYTPGQASRQLYLASGTTDDWSYGVLGIPSFTFEVGSSSDGFFAPCDRYDALIQPNLPAFVYAARIADSPYERAQGPQVTTLQVRGTGPFTVTATLSSSQPISTAHLYLGIPPEAGGQPLLMQPADGAWDENDEVAYLGLMGTPVPENRLVWVCGQDSAGRWGACEAILINPYLNYRVYLPVVQR